MKHISTFESYLNEDNGKELSLNENYGQELDKLQKAFDKAVESMRGSSILQVNGAIQVWIDFGERNQFCDETGKLSKTLK